MHLEDTVNTVLVIATFSLAKILHMSCIDFFFRFWLCGLLSSGKFNEISNKIWANMVTFGKTGKIVLYSMLMSWRLKFNKMKSRKETGQLHSFLFYKNHGS